MTKYAKGKPGESGTCLFVFDPQSDRRVARRERLGLNSAFERLERAKRGFERPDARARAR